MVQSYAQVLVAKGRAEGRAEGQAEALLILLEFRFGQLPSHVYAAIKALPAERLKELICQVTTAQSLDELHLD